MSTPGPCRRVFPLAVGLSAVFAGWGLLWPEQLAASATSALTFTTRTFGWFYLLAAGLFLGFCVYLYFSRFAHVRLGMPGEPPEYSYRSWLAMLFSAGMGIGLVFWGVAEPLYHFADPPFGQAAAESPEAARLALRYSLFHWCLHPWAIYTVIALAIAYTQFRRRDSGLISAVFRPWLGRRADGLPGNCIDLLAAQATVFGVATSLGFGTLQIAGGIEHLFGANNTVTLQLSIIVVVTVLYLLSAVTGLNKGILWLSNANLVLAAVLMGAVLFLGPTVFVIEAFVTVMGGYLQNLVQMSLRLTPFTQGEWVGSWTLFYWAWWIAWAPFVGSFIARVSRGRTIREFIGGVLLVPSVIGAFWFATFGGTALHGELFGDGGLAEAVKTDVTTTLFALLGQLPWGTILGGLAALLIVTFFVTSADSATFVLGMLTSKGDPNPPTWVKLVWGVLQSSIAAALLLSGGLQGLQTASIVAALPFAVILVLMVFVLLRALREDHPREARTDVHPGSDPALGFGQRTGAAQSKIDGPLEESR